MNIKKALIPTGKAIPVNDDCGGYVTVFGEDLHWFVKKTDEKIYRVSIQAILNTEWLPYFEDDVEIVPENVGEIWKHTTGLQFATVRNNGGKISFRCCEDDYGWDIDSDNLYQPVAHNNSGWTRDYPKVEEVPEDEEIMDEEDRQLIEDLTGEEVFPFYVKITGCSGEHFWYKDKIGTYYKVIGRELTESSDRQYKIDDGVSLINLDDCVIVELQEK